MKNWFLLLLVTFSLSAVAGEKQVDEISKIYIELNCYGKCEFRYKEASGHLVYMKKGEEVFKIPVYLELGSFGLIGYNKHLGGTGILNIKNIKGKPISDIFSGAFFGASLGHEVFLPPFIMTGRYVINRNLVAVNIGTHLLSIGVDFQLKTIEVHPGDQEKYDEVKDIIFE